MIRAARRGKRVVRLKGGDPFVFGRGGEEALALAMAGVPFEVVPGVTTAVAAAELAGIPVTHRGLASGFLVLAGHTSASVDATLALGSAEQHLGGDSDGRRRRGGSCVAADRPRLVSRDACRHRVRGLDAAMSGHGRGVSMTWARAGPPLGAAGVLVIGEVVRVRDALQRAVARPVPTTR